MNMMRESDDRQEMNALRLVSKNLLGIDIDFWGEIRYDPAVVAAIKSLQPEMLLTPGGRALDDVKKIADKFLSIAASTNVRQDLSKAVRATKRVGLNLQRDFVRICNFRCIAWNCCDQRYGGYRCLRLSPPAPKLRFA